MHYITEPVAIDWQSQWISRRNACLISWRAPVLPAPLLRREFPVRGAVRTARVAVCGLGFFELYISGRRVGDHVLDPVVSQYDRRARYVVFDVSDMLRRGGNAVAVMLGNGLYNSHTPEVWHFDKAPWRDYPKLLLQLEVTLEDGTSLVIASGPQWKIGDGPIVFDGLRNGETYDARIEHSGWTEPGFDDADWLPARVVPGPGGRLEQQTFEPCKLIETLEPVSVDRIDDRTVVYDLGQSISGWAQLAACADASTEVTLRYGELLANDGRVDQTNLNRFLPEKACQTDRYIFAGRDCEVWEPRFTYHGFRYVEVSGLPGEATLANLRGRVVHTAFERVGRLETSDETVNRLQDCTLWSYRGNFVGIPTDCPHREKNAWTGDAQLAAETGLMNFRAAANYAQWLDTLADTQRLSGQLPGIAPTAGWGYNWGAGPAWDGAFLHIPYYLYLYTGDLTVARRHYDGMKLYVDFCDGLCVDGILDYGLGDWCPVDEARVPAAALTSTGYHYAHARLVAMFAEKFSLPEDHARYAAMAERIKAAFNARYYRGDGMYDEGQQTALACAVFQGLVEDDHRQAVVDRLVEAVLANDAKPDFGILGAKYVPRVLAEHGHAKLAFRLLTQPDYPGWVHWLTLGATTLWERWNGGGSRNHIMYGDISAWFYHYLAGIRPDPQHPGFERVIFQPTPVDGLDWAEAEHQGPHGTIRSRWQRMEAGVECRLDIPNGSTGLVILPDRSTRELAPGQHGLTIG